MDNHNLIKDFEEYKDVLLTLKATNAHFKKLFEEYERTDKAIVRAEQRIELLSDVAEEALRKERLNLKDQMYTMLKEHSC